VDTSKEWAVFAVEDGQFHYGVGSDTGIAQGKDLVFCPPDTPLIRKAITPLTFHYMLFQFVDAASNVVGFQENLPFGKVSISNTNRLFSTFSLLREVSYGTDDFHLARQNHLFNDIWQLYVSELSGILSNENLIESENVIMNHAMNYIKENAFKKIYINQIARLHGLSQIQFSRKFYSAFKINPVDYLTNLRLKKAQKLLCESSLSIDEIAVRCGFDNGFYLSRVFTHKLNITPSKFRKSCKL
jgi:AraC-like DNA-binding protein